LNVVGLTLHRGRDGLTKVSVEPSRP